MSSATAECEYGTSRTESNFLCPKCGRDIPCTSHGLPEHPSCPDCKTLLWCRKQAESDSLLLHAIPGTTPEMHDMAAVGESLRLSQEVRVVVLNLCDLETINSSFVAGLLVMRRLIESAGAKLVLCVPPQIRDILQILNLHTLFSVENCDHVGAKAV